MRIVLIALLCLAVPLHVAHAQGGVLGMFNDINLYDPAIGSPNPGIVNLYVLHMTSGGVTASQFSAPLPGCWLGSTYLADGQVFPVTIGNSQSGVSVGYGACLTPPIHILTIQVFTDGQQFSDCCFYSVQADPAVTSGFIEVVDCGNNLIQAYGMTSCVNSPEWCCSFPTEATTWGSLKSLYSD